MKVMRFFSNSEMVIDMIEIYVKLKTDLLAAVRNTMQQHIRQTTLHKQNCSFIDKDQRAASSELAV